jgi:7,8-dihydro-6-hydroxymethylpterin-pyrophosphokinase
LIPIAEIAPDWRHPILELTAAQLLARLSSKQQIEHIP